MHSVNFTQKNMAEFRMRYQLPLEFMFIMLLITIIKIETHIIDTSFNIVGQGQQITGKLGSEMLAGSPQECALRCLIDYACHGYQYQQITKGKGKCFLIHKGCGSKFQRNVEYNTNGNVVLMTNEREKINKMWIEPCGWTGPQAAFYQSFDSSEGFVLWEGLNKTNSANLVSGQVNSALSLDETMSQWVDLGIHTEACLTRPETCGVAGGAISLWVNFMSFSTGGIISSLADGSSGIFFSYTSAYIQFQITLQEEEFFTILSIPQLNIWIHIVMNYLGPNDTVQIYLDGSDVEPDYTFNYSENHTLGGGRITVGKWFSDHDSDYATMEIDELIFFNQALNNIEIQLLYNSTKI